MGFKDTAYHHDLKLMSALRRGARKIKVVTLVAERKSLISQG